jgi:tetratricopeptide (TPR) repeat protein
MNQSHCKPKLRLLPRSELLHLEAAEGWLILGDLQEASLELSQIEPEYQEHPQVLEVEWRKCEASGDAHAAWLIARRLCELAPDQPSVWVCQANSLRHCKGLKPAAELLMSVAARFSDEPIIPYNLACYLAQLGNWQESCQWLLCSFEIENGEQLKAVALMDPDLKPLWEAIGESVILITEEPSPEAGLDSEQLYN